MPSKSYRDLVVWQKAMDLAQAVYDASSTWPSEERFGLTSQVRRAAVSVPSNIAEGQGRSTPRDFLNFLSIARGSLLEMETQLLLAGRLGFLSPVQSADLLDQCDQVSRLLRGLAASIAKPPTTRNPLLATNN